VGSAASFGLDAAEGLMKNEVSADWCGALSFLVGVAGLDDAELERL
jgi:hypothetical protein